MIHKNKYINSSKISESKFREIVRYFVADLSATQIATLSGISRNSINKYVMDNMMHNIAVIGSSGTIGSAFIRKLSELYPDAQISGFSRNKSTSDIQNAKFYELDYTSEESIANSAEIAAENAPLDLVIVATGILHNGEIMPEKSMRELSATKFQQVLYANRFSRHW